MIESDVLSWNSKVANAILAQVQGTYLGNPERASSIHSRYPQVYARRRPGRRTIAVVLPGTFTKTGRLEPLVAPYSKSIVGCIPEEILGIAWELPEGSGRCEERSPCSRQARLRSRARQIVATVERLRTQVIAGKAPLHSTLWQNQEIYTLQQEEDVDKRDLRPRYSQRKEHCRDSRESVILRVNTPMTLPEKKKRRGRDQNPLLQCLPRLPLEPFAL